METRIAHIRSQLVSQFHIKVKQNWLESMIYFYAESLPDFDNISNETLLNEAVDQFSVADVRSASVSVIPNVILQKKEIFNLNGNFVLQMQYLIDISETPFDQYRRLHNLKTDEAEEKQKESKTFAAKKKRMLKLELSDGYKTIHAIEYMPIAALNTKLSPGVKLRLEGPIKVSNHILLLESKNVKILGGDVEELLIVNAYENVLLRALKRPLTDTPLTNYIEETTVAADRPKIQEPAVANPHFEDDDVDMEELLQIEQEVLRKQAERHPTLTDDDGYDDLLGQIDLEAIENQMSRSEPPPEIPMEVAQSSSKSSKPNLKALIPSNYVQTREVEMNCEAFPSPPRKIAKIESTKTVSFADRLYKYLTHEGDPIVTIDQYMTLKPVQKIQKNFVVRGDVDKIEMNSLRIIDDHWKLNGVISDEYSRNTIPVRFHSQILEVVSGKTACEMKSLYTEAKIRPQIKDDIKKVVENLQYKLVSEMRFMKLEMNYNIAEPCECILREIVDCSPENLEMFEKKIVEEKLLKTEN